MKLEAVTVCVDYADFLAWTISSNKHLFDRWVVVTTKDDLATKALCEFHHVQCVQTGALRTDEGLFCKGAGINVGLEQLDGDGWVCHLDADIALPPLFRLVLETADLDPTMVYGCDRFVIPDCNTWVGHTRKPRLQHEASIYVHADAYDIATRISTPSYGGYVPIGFFQLWNPSVSGVQSYPDTHTDAGRTDMLFAGLWPRSKRGFLPEIICYHLESDSKVAQGTNWNGRKTPVFERQSRFCRWWRRRKRWKRRKKHHHVDPPDPPTPYVS